MNERCETHGCELSQCGEMTEEEPATDCRECQLEATIAELREKVSLMGERPDHYRVFMDGTSWCATGLDFIDLQNSNAAFGDSPPEALSRLRSVEREDDKP